MSEATRDRGWIAWMARNRVAANLLMVVFLVGGFLVTRNIQQEVFPEFELDIVTVSVPYLGATPTDVEQGVIEAIEEEIQGLDGVKKVTSYAREGAGSVLVELLVGTNAEKALQDIDNAVNRISSFPAETERPIVSLATNRRKVIDLVIYGDEDERTLRRVAEDVRAQLKDRPGITLVELAGVREPEIGVEVSQAQLRAYNVTLADVAGLIRRRALEVPGGGVKTPGGEVLVRMDERRDFARDFVSIPLVRSANGGQVRLGDIATITDTFEDNDQATYFDGKRAAVVQVYRVGKETPIEVAGVVRDFADEFNRDTDTGIRTAVIDDDSEIYRDRIRLLLRNAGLGLVLVLLTLSIFLDIRLAFWVTLGIPVSFLGAMLLLPGFEISINMISLFAFIMALGMVVDDAIVVGENIYEMRQRGVPFLHAAVTGARQIAMPVVFSVLTNMVAFAPMFFIPGFAGKIFRVIPAIIIPVFLVSLIESLFILPHHLGHQATGRQHGVFAFFGRQQQRVSRGLAWAIRAFYGPVLRTALRWRYLTLAIGVGVLVLTIGFVAGGRINILFFPNVASDFATATVELPFGAPVEQTRAVMDQLVESAKAVLDEQGGGQAVRGIQARIGQASALGRGPGRNPNTGGHMGYVRVDLEPGRHDALPTREFVRLWHERVGTPTNIKALTFKSDLGPGGEAPINIELNHRDITVLETAATELANRLGEFAGVADIDNGFSRGKRQFNVTVSPEGESLGINTQQLGSQVRHAFYGAEALRQQRGRDEVKVMVRLPEAERRSEYDVEELVIRSSEGGEIALLEAGNVEKTRSYTQIKRTDGRRVINVSADVDAAVTNADKVVAEVTKTMLPDLLARYPGLGYSLEGERRNLAESLDSLQWGFVVALIVIFAMLAIPLGSYVQPLIIMTAIPFGIVGSVLGHVMMGYNLSLMSMMGIVALAGVVVNDSLVLTCAINDRRANKDSVFDAVSSAGVRRFRPIILTSLTTFFGLAPMIFETSMQARFLIPMAISLGYGVLMATFITLLLVPSLYLIVEDLERLVKGPQTAESPSAEEPTSWPDA